jgi:hypothetical protein
MEQLTSKLFGLEPKHLLSCGQTERSAYSRILVFFLIVLLTMTLSIYYFFYLLLQSYWWAIIPTLMLCFVFFSLLRFLLITIQLPLSEAVSIKKVILNGANIFRLVLFSLLVFTFSVPIVSFFYRNSIETDLGIYKSELLSEFVASKEQMRNQQLQSIDNLIASYKSEQRDILASSTTAEIKKFKIDAISEKIDLLKVTRQDKSEKLVKMYADQTSNYDLQLKDAGMPFKRFELLFQMKRSIPTIILIFLPLFLLLPLFVYLKYSQKYFYSKLFGEEMIQLITMQYNETKTICEQELKERFNFIKKDNVNYLDPPFNRLPIKQIPTKLTNQTLFNFLDNNS